MAAAVFEAVVLVLEPEQVPVPELAVVAGVPEPELEPVLVKELALEQGQVPGQVPVAAEVPVLELVPVAVEVLVRVLEPVPEPVAGQLAKPAELLDHRTISSSGQRPSSLATSGAADCSAESSREASVALENSAAEVPELVHCLEIHQLAEWSIHFPRIHQ